jgi:single-strand DNA-binding protein
MSRSLNKVQLIGNLGADPEIRTTANGSKVAQFSLATSRQWNTAAGDKQEKTEWHKCVAWNSGSKGSGLADIIERYVKKGDKLFVEGRIEYRQYEDRDKKMMYVTEINVQEILLLGTRNDPAAVAARTAAPARATSSTRDEGFSDFPEAMEGDDDLPF